MQLRVFTEPQQGASYAALLAVARAAEDLGFDGFFRSDHFLADSNFPVTGPGGLPGPSDAWITLAGLARETRRLRLGTLMTSATFRHPGPLAVAVAGVDEMSGGRIELGIGTGWYEAEHRAYGIPFPEQAERFERLAEQLQVITGLWATPPGRPFSFSGRYYQLAESPALPKPVQPRPPIIVGGTGPRRTPHLAACHADEFNIPYPDLEAAAAQFGRVRAACEAVGRDPDTIRLSATLPVCCGRDDREVARRAETLGREPADLRRAGLAGTPGEVLEAAGRYAAIGAEQLYLALLDLADLDQLALVAEQVLPGAAAIKAA
jgi:F420-dependent oxidoreductase-like protein